MKLNAQTPLGLPVGSVRALLTFLLVATVTVTMFVPIADGAGSVRDSLLVLTGIAVRDYFATRTTQDAADPPLPPPSIG